MKEQIKNNGETNKKFSNSNLSNELQKLCDNHTLGLCIGKKDTTNKETNKTKTTTTKKNLKK